MPCGIWGLGKYDPIIMTESFVREREIMENPPEGAEAIVRYANVGGRGGFVHIVKADSAEKLGALLLEFVGPRYMPNKPREIMEPLANSNKEK